MLILYQGAGRDALRSECKIKTETLGCDIDNKKEIIILNTVVRINADGLELEADPRHAELLIRELDFVVCKPTRVPGAKAVPSPTTAR